MADATATIKAGRELLQETYDAEPHYIIHAETGWRSMRYPNKAAAQSWIDGYQVTQEYKDRCYRVVNAREYESRHWKK